MGDRKRNGTGKFLPEDQPPKIMMRISEYEKKIIEAMRMYAAPESSKHELHCLLKPIIAGLSEIILTENLVMFESFLRAETYLGSQLSNVQRLTSNSASLFD